MSNIFTLASSFLLFFSVASVAHGRSFLMTVGGYGSDAVNFVAMDANNQTLPKCLQNATHFPTMIWDAGGAVLNGMPTVCGGGYNEGDEPTSNRCNHYDVKNKTWSGNGTAVLHEPRSMFGSCFSPDWGLVMAGGIGDGGQKQLSSAENTTDGRNVAVIAQELPKAISGNCMVALSDERLLSTGGFDGVPGNVEKAAYMYAKAVWQTMADMTEGRKFHGCGSAVHAGVESAFVAGGIGVEERILDSVEMYSVAENKWRSMPRLPTPTYLAASVPYNGTFLLVGGLTKPDILDTIVEYDAASGHWNVQPYKLEHAQYSLTAIVLNDVEC